MLIELVQAELASVVFVRDHVQLDFDGPRFTFWVWPRVQIPTGTYDEGDPGYRDALCSLINARVIATNESSEIGIHLDFNSGSLGVGPNPTLVGPEIAMLQMPDGPWAIWRPGEDTFESAG